MKPGLLARAIIKLVDVDLRDPDLIFLSRFTEEVDEDGFFLVVFSPLYAFIDGPDVKVSG